MRQLTAIFLFTTLSLTALARMASQGFEGWPAGTVLWNYYFAIYQDSNVAANASVVSEIPVIDPDTGDPVLDPDTGDPLTTNAVGYNLNTSNYLPDEEAWLVFETSEWYVDKFGGGMDHMQTAMAFVAPDAPTGFVDSFWYYFYVDTDDNGIDDLYYETLVTDFSTISPPLYDVAVLQTYPRVYTDPDVAAEAGAVADSWDRWDADYTTQDASGVVPDQSHLLHISYYGFALALNQYPGPATDEFATFWIDCFCQPIPEPSSCFILAVLGAGTLGRRRRF